MEWRLIETLPPNGKYVLMGYAADGKVHLTSKYGVGCKSAGLVPGMIWDWPWTMPPTHWAEIPELQPATSTQ